MALRTELPPETMELIAWATEVAMVLQFALVQASAMGWEFASMSVVRMAPAASVPSAFAMAGLAHADDRIAVPVTGAKAAVVGLLVAHCRNSHAASGFLLFLFMPTVQYHTLGRTMPLCLGRLYSVVSLPYLDVVGFSIALANDDESLNMAAAPPSKIGRAHV